MHFWPGICWLKNSPEDRSRNDARQSTRTGSNGSTSGVVGSTSPPGDSPGLWHLGCWTQKNRGNTPKMDGENNGKPWLKWDDLGGKPTIFGYIHFEPGSLEGHQQPSQQGHNKTCWGMRWTNMYLYSWFNRFFESLSPRLRGNDLHHLFLLHYFVGNQSWQPIALPNIPSPDSKNSI